MQRSKIGTGLLTWLALASMAGAAVFHVKPDATGSGASWTDAASLTAAVAAVQPADQIWVAAGTYTGSWNTWGPSIYGGFAGTETELSQRDPAANPTILNGDGSANRILSAGSRGETEMGETFPPAVVDGLIFQNAKGGALSVYAGNNYITVSNCIFRNNSVTGKGGGIYAQTADGISYAIIERCVFRSNAATAAGGALYITASGFVDSNLCVNNTSGQGATIAGYWSMLPPIFGGSTSVNNTVVHNTGDGISGKAINNIVAFNTGLGIDLGRYNDARFIFDGADHNCLWQNGGGAYYSNKDIRFFPGSLARDPGFVADPTDFRLKADSPCRNAGSNAALGAPTAADLDGAARRQGVRVDMGCYETAEAVIAPPPVIRVKPGGNDQNDGATWETAKATLQAATDDLYGAEGEAWAAAGAYVPVKLNPGTALYGGFAGTETDRSQRNPRANVSAIDAGGLSISCVDTPFYATSATVVDGFTLRNSLGSSLFDNTEYQHGSLTYMEWHRGGGVYVEGGSPIIRNNVITGNNLYNQSYTYGSSGGGVYVAYGTPTVVGNVITGNKASTGAGICCAGQATIASNLIVNNVKDPAGSSIRGEGLYWANTKEPTAGSITNNTLVGNGMWLKYAPAVTNNIVAFANYGVAVPSDSIPTAANFHHNDVFGSLTADYSGFTAPAGNFSVDPLFVDRTQADYRLAAGSPCTDAGDDASVPAGLADITGAARIQGLHVDLGAYETPVALTFTIADAADALRIAAGLAAADAASATRLNAMKSPPSTGAVDLTDAVTIARLCMDSSSGADR